MGLEENKERARALFRAIEAGRREPLAALFAPNARWVIPKSAPEPFAGIHVGAEKIADMMAGSLESSFEPGSGDWRVGLTVAEGDVVMAEANLRARTPAGESYDNQYVFVVEFDPASGCITELREHTDTRYAASFFEGALAEPAAGAGTPGSPPSGPHRLADR